MPDLLERNKLIEENLPLVGYLAREVHTRASHVPYEELAAAGAVGIVQAAEVYDPTKGIPFGAFARKRILGAMADEMRSMDWLSRRGRERVKDITDASTSLTVILGRAPSTEEVAEYLGITREQVIHVTSDASRPAQNIDESPAVTMPSALALPDESAMMRERRELLELAVQALPERMRQIVRGVYIEERTVGDLAAELGVTHGAISQQRSEAIRLLRDALERFDEGGTAAPTSRVSAAARADFFSRIAEAKSQNRRS